MTKRDTTVLVAAYADLATAESDWSALEAVAKEGLYVADAALVAKDAEGSPEILERQSHHGWGKGAVVGAVLGVLFPPSLVASAIAGGVAGGAVAGLTRSLGRSKVKSLGEVLDKGEIALIAVVDTASIVTFERSLAKAVEYLSEESGLTDDDLREASVG